MASPETFSNVTATFVDVFSNDSFLNLEAIIGPTAAKFLSQFFGNDYLTGTFIISLLSTLFVPVRKYLSETYDWICSLCYASMQIEETDEAFQWVQVWIADNAHLYRYNNINLKTKWKKDNESHDLKDGRPELLYTPARGIQRIQYRGRTISITRQKDPDTNNAPTVITDSSSSTSSLTKKNDLMTLAIRHWNVQPLKDFFNDVMEYNFTKKEGRTTIYTLLPYSESWITACTRVPRPFSSVILQEGLKADLLSDINLFRTSMKWYQSRGIPYRRGYLLHGPPGTGKTSVIVALAGELKCSVCVVNLSMSGLSDSDLNQLLNEAPKNAFLLFEDVDSAFVEDEEDGDWVHHSNRMTLSGLLNALDGVMAQEGCVVFMTTNHIEKLAPALLRPGRCDRKFCFDYADEQQMVDLFLRFFAPDGEGRVLAMAKEFGAGCITTDVKITPAQLQGHFMLYRDNPIECLGNLKEFIEECKIERQREQEAKEKRKQKENDRKKKRERAKAKAEREKLEEEKEEEEEGKLEDEMKEKIVK